jgi:hypothetical protein
MSGAQGSNIERTADTRNGSATARRPTLTPHAYNAPMMGIPKKPPIVATVEMPVNRRPAARISTCEARKERKVTGVLEPNTTKTSPTASVARLGASAMTAEPAADNAAPSRDKARSLVDASSCRCVVIQQLAMGNRTKYSSIDTHARREYNSPAWDARQQWYLMYSKPTRCGKSDITTEGPLSGKMVGTTDNGQEDKVNRRTLAMVSSKRNETQGIR